MELSAQSPNVDQISINKRLKGIFGSELDGRAKFRLVWSANQLETRFGEFEDFYGRIYLRTVAEVRTVPKYKFVRPPTWLIERLITIESVEEKVRQRRIGLAEFQKIKQAMDGIHPAHNKGYEAIYQFSDKNDNPLPVHWWVVEKSCYLSLNRPKPEFKSDEQYHAETNAEDERYFEQAIDLDSMLGYGGGISMATKKVRESPWANRKVKTR